MLVSGLAAVTLVLLVPFALMMSVVYFDDNPRSEHPFAQTTGRMDVSDTMMRATFVFVTRFLHAR